MKMTARPGAIVLTPRRATADPALYELSSIFHPVRSTAVPPRFVTSNQSWPTGELPLDQGATSVMSGDNVHEWVHDARHLLGFPCH